MGDVRWIKIVTDVFDDEKILMIETMPECDTIIVIWFKLLCLAGKQNNSGVFMMGQMPYTDEMFAAIFRRNINTVRLALNTFERFGMIEIIRDTVTIPNWGKHQNLDQLESKKAYMRNYMHDYREKQKALTTGKANCKTNSKTNVSLAEEDIEEEKNKKEDKSICQQVVDMYHDICKSFPAVRSLSDARRKSIKARLKDYTMDDFRQVFQNAEASSFLKGLDGGWKASFDWMIKEANMLKVLEGNYADKGWKQKSVMQPSMSMGQAELEAIQRVLSEDY